MKTCLTIAGSDSGAGAGIQADLKTFAAHGVYGTSAITAITAQNSLGVSAVQAVTSDLVTAQIEAIMSDFGADAAKTGMLPSAAVVEAVAAAIQDFRIAHVVVDPVMVAKSGDRLADEDAVLAIRSELLPRAFTVTPNIPEAEILAGMPIVDDMDRYEAARRIRRLGVPTVVIKGGHWPGPLVRDLLFDGAAFLEFTEARIPGTQTHGTGCTFSAAIAARLTLGRTLAEAVPEAQRYVARAIAQAPRLGRGHGPLQHIVSVY